MLSFKDYVIEYGDNKNEVEVVKEGIEYMYSFIKDFEDEIRIVKNMDIDILKCLKIFDDLNNEIK